MSRFFFVCFFASKLWQQEKADAADECDELGILGHWQYMNKPNFPSCLRVREQTHLPSDAPLTYSVFKPLTSVSHSK